MNEKKLKKMIINIGNKLIEMGFISGTEGNISGRLESQDWFFITPSGIAYSQTKPEDLLGIDLKGNKISGDKKASIEYNMHLKIFQKRKDVNVIIHTHSFYAKTVACVRKNIPPLLDNIAIMFGGPIEVAEYARPGSLKLAENVADKLTNKNATLIANHGAIAVGKDFEEAMEYCNLIEDAAKVMIFANIIGKPVPLTNKQIEEDLNFFNSQYGQ